MTSPRTHLLTMVNNRPASALHVEGWLALKFRVGSWASKLQEFGSDLDTKTFQSEKTRQPHGQSGDSCAARDIAKVQ